MKIRIQSDELNRMVKIIKPCLDTKNMSKPVIQVTHEESRIILRASNGVFAAETYAPLLGGDGETFCVDGSTFSRVTGICRGFTEISTDERSCTVKGTGRTRIPILPMKVAEMRKIKGKYTAAKAEFLKGCYKRVAYAVSQQQTRPVLTGILTETNGRTIRMVSLDGFQMAVEEIAADSGETFSAIIPGAFMEWVTAVSDAGETLKLTTDGKLIEASTDWMKLQCTLLAGEYVDYHRLIPKQFATTARISTPVLLDALKCGQMIGNKLRIVKISLRDDTLTVSSNSEEADYHAEIPCEMQGNELDTAFNESYLINTVGVIGTDKVFMKFNAPTSPVIITDGEGKGIHMCLPVRILSEGQSNE